MNPVSRAEFATAEDYTGGFQKLKDMSFNDSRDQIFSQHDEEGDEQDLEMIN